MKDINIRILVVEPGKSPRVEHVKYDWEAWYPLVDPTTDTLQTLTIAPGIDLLFDEEGRQKQFPLNVRLAANSPAAYDYDFVVDTTQGKGMKPGEPGVGYFDILGTFLIAAYSEDGDYVDLTDEDINIYKTAIGRGGL